MEMTHTLFLTDPLQSWYLRSNANMDVDPFAATLAIVTAEIEELGPTRVICIGSSMGGYAATRCALALGTLEDKCLREARLFEAAVAMLTESLASQTPSLAPRVCVEVCVHDTIGESDGHCVAASLKAAGRLDAILSPYLCAL